MSTAIKLQGLSMPEAEEAIAELWTCLEEYGIPSAPKLKVSGTNSRITIEMSRFDEPLWSKFVENHLTNWRRCTLMSPSRPKDNGRAQLVESGETGIAEIPLGAIAQINRKAKRRHL
jgi:hypothetical protein